MSTAEDGSIEAVSQRELERILAFLEERSEGDRPPILLGGWAVVAYNAYSRSQDIDLALSSRHRSSLVHWLRSDHRYEPKRMHRDGWHGAVKHVAPLDQDVVVDIATYEETYRFEGRQAQLGFDEALDHHEPRRVAGIATRVPTRSLLLLYKLKAAWDRSYRLEHDAADQTGREEGKLVKDRADLLALTDPDVDAPWELAYLQEKLTELDFLVPTLRQAARSEPARQRYRSTSREDAEDQVENLLGLLDL
jgi:hypothetical protein